MATTQEEMDAIVAGFASRDAASANTETAQSDTPPDSPDSPAENGSSAHHLESPDSPTYTVPLSIQEMSDDWMVENGFIWDGMNYIHVCADCDLSAQPPRVHCPVCYDVVEMSAQGWYACSCYPQEKTDQQKAEEYYQQNFGDGIQWLTSKKGNLYAKHNGMIMHIRQDKDETYSTCAQIEDAEDKKPFIRWKSRIKTLEEAKMYITSRVDEAKAVKLF